MKESKPHVVVSLTSFPGAIMYAPGAIRSVLEGSVKPDRVVLYVTMSQFGDKGLPVEVTSLVGEYDNFEIRDYDRDIRSYRKLVPALADFPESVIVTIDDDVAYHPDMLRDLLDMHERFPNDVLAHRAKRVLVGRPYKKWKKYRWYHFLFRKIYRSFGNIQTGVGGVLYPPHSLRADMIDAEKFVRLAPTADDLWFWAAAVANDRCIIPVPFGRNKPRGLGKPKELSLKTVNFKSGIDRNTAALEAILAAYPEVKERLEMNINN
ncbi:MAG: hypothetical protein NC082_07930 [Clostridiales bacterium]|nr:hypothetical protein [Clostridiales bacterium]